VAGFWQDKCARAFGLTLLLALFSVPVFAADAPGTHEGVASCGGSTCHGRLAPTGKTVRQNELITWQDTTSAAGSHSQAWQVLNRSRAHLSCQKPATKTPYPTPAVIPPKALVS